MSSSIAAGISFANVAPCASSAAIPMRRRCGRPRRSRTTAASVFPSKLKRLQSIEKDELILSIDLGRPGLVRETTRVGFDPHAVAAPPRRLVEGGRLDGEAQSLKQRD